MTNLYTSLADVPRPNSLIAAYDTQMGLLCHGDKPLPISRIDDLDGLIRTLELLSLDARARRNAAASFTLRLPPEVLSIILHILAAEEQPYPAVIKERRDDHEIKHVGELFDPKVATNYVWRDTHNDGSLGWIRLTHVCRRWRDLLLGMETLWAGVLGRLPSADDEILRRAGDHTLLSVTATSTAFHICNPQIMSKLATAHLFNRLRTLHLAEIRLERELVRTVEALCSQIQENLEVLGVYYSYYGNFIWPTSAASQSILIAPTLRIVRFEGYFIPFHSTSLQELYLDHCARGAGLTTALLFDTLRAAAETLESLELSLTLPSGFDVEAQSFPELSLPHLRKLSLVGGKSYQQAFLQRVRLPHEVQLDVEIYFEFSIDPMDADGGNFRSYVAEELQPLVDTIIACGHAKSTDGLAAFHAFEAGESDEVGSLCLHLYSDSFQLACSSTSSHDPFHGIDPKLKLRLMNGFGRNSSLDVVFTEVSRMLDPIRFVTMSIAAFPFWFHHQISTVLSPFTGLRLLHIIDPLEYIDAHLPYHNMFPFLSAQSSLATSSTPRSEFASSKTYALEMLWLVHTSPMSAPARTEWNATIARQLRRTLVDGWRMHEPATGIKPIKTLRIYDACASLDDERGMGTSFSDLADVVECRRG